MINWLFPNKKRRQRVILAMYAGKTPKGPLDNKVQKYEACGHFDEVRVYTFDMLPEAIQKMDLPDYTPFMILDIMKDMHDNDILAYTDITNIYDPENNWKRWLNVISKNSALFFFHGDTMDGMSERMIQDYYYRTKIFPALKFNGDLFFLKKKACSLIEEWRDNMRLVDSEVSSRIILNYAIYHHLDDDKIRIVIQD